MERDQASRIVGRVKELVQEGFSVIETLNVIGMDVDEFKRCMADAGEELHIDPLEEDYRRRIEQYVKEA